MNTEMIELTQAGTTLMIDKISFPKSSIKAIAKPSNSSGCIVYLMGDKFLVKESYDKVVGMVFGKDC